jgi:hypothetical protein
MRYGSGLGSYDSIWFVAMNFGNFELSDTHFGVNNNCRPLDEEAEPSARPYRIWTGSKYSIFF